MQKTLIYREAACICLCMCKCTHINTFAPKHCKPTKGKSICTTCKLFINSAVLRYAHISLILTHTNQGPPFSCTAAQGVVFFLGGVDTFKESSSPMFLKSHNCGSITYTFQNLMQRILPSVSKWRRVCFLFFTDANVSMRLKSFDKAVLCKASASIQ